MSLFMLRSDATTSWSWHQKCKRSSGDFTSIHLLGILMFMSVLQSSTELACAGYIYNVLCTSRCVVFYNVPPLMGQVLGKVLLTSWEIN